MNLAIILSIPFVAFFTFQGWAGMFAAHNTLPMEVHGAKVYKEDEAWKIRVEFSKYRDCGKVEIYRWQISETETYQIQDQHNGAAVFKPTSHYILHAVIYVKEMPGSWYVKTIVNYPNCPEGARTVEFDSDVFTIPPN